VDLTTDEKGGADDHAHDVVIGSVTTAVDGDHPHDIDAAYFKDQGGDKSIRLAPDVDGSDLTELIGAKAAGPGSEHSHGLELGTITSSSTGGAESHFHAITGQATEAVGVADDGSGGARTSGSELSYLNRVKVYLDDNEITSELLAQLGGPTAGWSQLGDGTATHALVATGTGAIDLLRLNFALVEGEHKLELRVDNASGGNIRYNLYVE